MCNIIILRFKSFKHWNTLHPPPNKTKIAFNVDLYKIWCHLCTFSHCLIGFIVCINKKPIFKISTAFKQICVLGELNRLQCSYIIVSTKILFSTNWCNMIIPLVITMLVYICKFSRFKNMDKWMMLHILL